MRNSCLLLLITFFACAPSVKKMDKVKATTEVDVVLSKWHKAAADANFEQYFGLMADSSIFMGTDSKENWTKKQFIDFSKPYFDRGRAWSFKATVRNIYIDDVTPMAWFDEELDTPNLGPARGSGILKKVNNEWKILHYNLSVPIPNELVDDFVKEIDDFHSKTNN